MKLPASLLLPALMWAGTACGQPAPESVAENPDSANEPESTDVTEMEMTEMIGVVLSSPDPKSKSKVSEDAHNGLITTPEEDSEVRYSGLTENDYRIVAKELGVEVAAIKAVVEIEAGKTLHGFFAPGVPVINFDPSMYKTYASKAPDRAPFKSMRVPDGLSGYGLKEWTQLVNACHKNGQGGLMGTFWGMFQIGGFNYKLCGCSSVTEFVSLMSESEFAQLELFARFVVNSGMVADLKNKNWAAFARKYNGSGYARRGYHTRMAAAYKKYKGK